MMGQKSISSILLIYPFWGSMVFGLAAVCRLSYIQCSSSQTNGPILIKSDIWAYFGHTLDRFSLLYIYITQNLGVNIIIKTQNYYFPKSTLTILITYCSNVTISPKWQFVSFGEKLKNRPWSYNKISHIPISFKF